MHRSTATVIATSALAALFAALLMGGCVPQQIGGTSATGVGSFNLPPTPVVTFDVDRGVAPLVVQFNSDRSSDDGLIVARLWDFADQTTSQEISPRHTFTTTGDFDVTLTLTDDNGVQSSRTVRISVTDAPVPVINADRTAAESAPALINFDASDSFDPDGEIVSFQWDFGDGSREFLQTVAHMYSVAGNFRAELTVTDDTGVTATASVLIQVGIPKPKIEVRVPAPDVANIVLSKDSPLWVQAVFDVDPSVARFVRAGLDGDRDQCEAQSINYALDTGAQIANLSGHTGPVNAVAVSPDGATILTASADGTVRQHNAAGGALIASFQGVGSIGSVAFSPDGLLFAYGQSNGDVVLRELAGGTIVTTLSSHTAAVNDLEFSPDGAQLLSGSTDRRALLWNLADGSILREFNQSLGINAVAISPSDPTLVATGSEDATIKLWNTTSGSELLTITGHTEAVNALTFSADGQMLLSGSDDDTARAWNPLNGNLIETFSGHTSNVVSVAITNDGGQVVTGSADTSVKIWDIATGTATRTLQPCQSTISSVAIAPDGTSFVAGVAAGNDIRLDSDPPNGNDLNVTIPTPLSLKNVLSLGGGDVPPAQYFLWVEIDTDQTKPVRAYANSAINVINAFTADISASTPQIPLVNDQAKVIVAPDAPRQVFDLGSLNQGDRLFLSFATTPGFGESFVSTSDFSLMVVDAANEIFAWFQPGFILFSGDSRLIIGHNSLHYYVITDGGNSISARIERDTGLDATRKQRVLVDFRGAAALRIAELPGLDVPVLDAADFNQFFIDAGKPNPNWGASETATIKTQIMQTLANLYAGFDVEFFSSDSATLPDPPFLTMYVGGESFFPFFGISDYIDPRNETTTGSGLTAANAIAQAGIADAFANPTDTPTAIGAAIGFVAAHEVGHLLGLRHSDDPTDVMVSGSVIASDPSTPHSFKSATVSTAEQFRGLPPIGTQNAPQLLIETVGIGP